MAKVSAKRNCSKVVKTPRRPYDKERLDQELKRCGEYGLRCKNEMWRTQLVLAKIRKAARVLLTFDEKNPRRIFQGQALLRRMKRYGLLDESESSLDFLLQLTTQKFLERRLQTQVFQTGLAKSIHHARVLIFQRHIRVNKKLVDVASFMTRKTSEKQIDYAYNSALGGGRPGRTKRKSERANKKGGQEAEE